MVEREGISVEGERNDEVQQREQKMEKIRKQEGQVLISFFPFSNKSMIEQTRENGETK